MQALLENGLASQSEPHNGEPASVGDLTTREQEVLRLMADGLSNREIAERLFLTVGTVKWYLSEIYSKLHVANRTQAVTHARSLKLLD